MSFLKLSTAKTVLVGPVRDSVGAVVAGAVIGDFNLTKNGSTAALAASATATYSHNGMYFIALLAANTDTIGDLIITANNASHSMTPYYATVVTAATYDALITNGGGVSGGLVINGTNAGNITIGGLTITQASSNTSALIVTGNGNAPAINISSGLSGKGIQITASSANGVQINATGNQGMEIVGLIDGIRATGNGGAGFYGLGPSASGYGMRLEGGTPSDSGTGLGIFGYDSEAVTIRCEGEGVGMAIYAGGDNFAMTIGTADSQAVYCYNNSTTYATVEMSNNNGSVLNLLSYAGNADCVKVTAAGSGNAVVATGGATGTGFVGIGNGGDPGFRSTPTAEGFVPDVVDSNLIQIDGATTVNGDAAPLEVTLADGVAHGGTPGSSTATFAMGSIYVNATSGDAITVASDSGTGFSLSGGNHGVEITSAGTNGGHDIALSGSGDILGNLLGSIDGLTPDAVADLLDLTDSIENNVTVREAIRLVLAAAAGKLSGAGGPIITIRNVGDTKDRIIAAVSAGNRTAVTTDAT